MKSAVPSIGTIASAMRRQPARWTGIVGLLVIVLMCIFVPVFSPYAPNDFVAEPFLAPSLAHPFGTDLVGRDLFTRVFAGGRVDLVAAAITTGFAFGVGTVMGTIAGASDKRWLSQLLMRIVDGLIALPIIVLLLALVAAIGSDRDLGIAPPGLPAALLALMCVQWSLYARLANAQASTMREADFVVAARIAGLSERTILTRYIMPGVARITRAYAVGDLVFVIIILSSLPFLGAGVQPPAAEWGSILYEGRGFLLQAWWITLLPGAVLALTGVFVSLIADSYMARERAG